MKYEVDQFILLDLDKEGKGIQNSNGFTILKDKRIYKFLKSIDLENRLELTDKRLSDAFGDEKKSITNFLLDTKIISKKPMISTYNSIKVLTNNLLLEDSIEFNKEGSSIKFECSAVDSSQAIVDKIKTTTFSNDELIVVALIPFDYIDFVNINDKLQHLNIPYMFCFSYNSQIYISNIHKQDWYNPCPKCFFSQLETSIRGYGDNTANTTFQTIVDLLYAKKIKFDPDLPVTYRNIIYLTQKILSLDKQNIERESATITSINLNGSVSSDEAVHWELCDCFE